MKADLWKEALLPSPNADQLWELFHENSKTGRYNYPPPDEVVLTAMVSMYQSLPFATYPAVELPTQRSPLCLSLAEAITSRATARNLASLPLSLADLAALLYYAYGVTRDNVGTNFSRPFRVVPSAGALYPLELFFDTASVEGLESGLYHYNPLDNVVRRIRHGDNRKLIQEILVQGDVAADSSLIILITAVFERSTIKYGDRGYRFALLEAGHVAQNINLVANALGLGSINLGGYFDRRADDFLGIDGLTHSTIYMAGIGAKTDSSDARVGTRPE